MGAGEAFKIAMCKLLPHTLSPENTASRFANTDKIRFELAPPDTPFCRDLGEIDCVSGGAITNPGLFFLARLSALTTRGRIIEPHPTEPTHLKRYKSLP